MPIELESLFHDLDPEQLGFRRPSKFLFFCGGAIHDAANTPTSLRGHLLKGRTIAKRLKTEIALAEAANQIWRETSYPDLITFEEDIAKIAAMVLVIVESPGALAELGTFSSIATIRQFLSIIVQEKFSKDESFVRLGPVERIMKEDPDRVAFYPWQTRRNGTVIKSTVTPHTKHIIAFLNKGLRKIPETAKLAAHPDITEFILLYWVIYLSQAIPITRLTAYTARLTPGLDIIKVQRALYCMKIAGWITSKHYSNVEYYYCLFDADPLVYRFLAKLPKAERDASRRRAQVASAIHKDLGLPKHILQVAFAARKRPTK